MSGWQSTQLYRRHRHRVALVGLAVIPAMFGACRRPVPPAPVGAGFTVVRTDQYSTVLISYTKRDSTWPVDHAAIEDVVRAELAPDLAKAIGDVARRYSPGDATCVVLDVACSETGDAGEVIEVAVDYNVRASYLTPSAGGVSSLIPASFVAVLESATERDLEEWLRSEEQLWIQGPEGLSLRIHRIQRAVEEEDGGTTVVVDYELVGAILTSNTPTAEPMLISGYERDETGRGLVLLIEEGGVFGGIRSNEWEFGFDTGSHGVAELILDVRSPSTQRRIVRSERFALSPRATQRNAQDVE